MYRHNYIIHFCEFWIIWSIDWIDNFFIYFSVNEYEVCLRNSTSHN